MSNEFNIRGLTGWMFCHGIYVLPIISEDAFPYASILVPCLTLSDSFEEYSTEQCSWAMGLSSSGARVVQVPIEDSDLLAMIARFGHNSSVRTLFSYAAGIAGVSASNSAINNRYILIDHFRVLPRIAG
jgi:hypothetical protein